MKAILIGATGLIGKELLKQLLADDHYSQVNVFTRRSTEVKHDKLKEQIIDFDHINSSSIVINGSVLFSTLGTTLKTAGSKERQREIDYDMQFNVAKIASKNGVKNLVLLSSYGANSKSNIFYSKMKGELDDAVKDLAFEKVSIVRPSMLTGHRKEFRLAEKILTPIMYAFSWVPGIRKYRPIKDITVAEAMINADKFNDKHYSIFELEAIFKLAKKNH